MSATVVQAQEFIVGLLGGLLNEHDLTTLEKCVQGSSSVATDVTDMINDVVGEFSITNMVKAVEQSKDIYDRLPTELSHCTNSQGDISRITSWA